NFVAILADDVVVVGVIGVIGVVKFVVAAEIHFAHQTAGGEERERAVNGGAGNRFVAAARPFKQLLGGKMFLGAENGVNNGAALRGDAQFLSLEEIHELRLGAIA